MKRDKSNTKFCSLDLLFVPFHKLDEAKKHLNFSQGAMSPVWKTILTFWQYQPCFPIIIVFFPAENHFCNNICSLVLLFFENVHSVRYRFQPKQCSKTIAHEYNLFLVCSF